MNDYIGVLHANYAKAYHVGPSGKTVNHADELQDVDFYLDSWLKALKNVTVYDSPITNGIVANKPIAQFHPGDIIGKVYSFVLKDGHIWWQLDDPTGKPFGWVQHAKGLFDPELALSTSSQKAIDDNRAAIKASDAANPVNKVVTAGGNVITGLSDVVAGAGKTLQSFGQNLHWIVLAILLGVMGYIIFNFKKL